MSVAHTAPFIKRSVGIISPNGRGASSIEKPVAICSANLFFPRIGKVAVYDQELSLDARLDLFRH